MKPPKGTQVDHRNGNGLDNRKWNLRICSHAQNNMNRGKQKNNMSGYKGVSWHELGKQWMAHIKIHGEETYLGLYPTKEETALAYNKGAKVYYGEFAKLNIIKE